MQSRTGVTTAALLIGLAIAVGVADAASAKKHRSYPGYSGIAWPDDFGVMSGHCDREAISTRTRNRTAFGSEDRDNRQAGMLIGATIEDLIRGALGRELDSGDRACLGHVLEIGKSGHTVRWDNAASGVHYEVVPHDAHDEVGGSCRTFRILATAGEGRSKRKATACEKGGGLWQLSRL